MAKTLVIQPVTRIEGHAKVTIQLNDAGNVDTARVNVIELRGPIRDLLRDQVQWKKAPPSCPPWDWLYPTAGPNIPPHGM